MFEIEMPVWLMLILGLAGVVILSVAIGLISFTPRRPVIMPPTPEPEPLFDRLYNGWVIVRRKALQPTDSDDFKGHLLPSLAIPQQVTFLLCELSQLKVFELAVLLNNGSREASNRDDLRRGLTIGSALFNYSIPESFVLVDEYTRRLTELFRLYDSTRKFTADWVKEEEMFENNKALFSNIESRSLNITREQAIEFYHQHAPMVAPCVLAASENRCFPHLSGFVNQMIVWLGLRSDDATIHQMHIVAVVVAELAELEVPMYWVMRSPLADAVLESAKGPTPMRPKLSLVDVNKKG